jgi:antirestriction protein
MAKKRAPKTPKIEEISSENPRVYVGTYAKYNSGNLKGRWLDLTDYADKDEFIDACRKLHKDEADPELMFQDHENIPKGMITESSISEDLWEWMGLDDHEKTLLQIYRRDINEDGTLDEARDAFNGVYSSPEDWAEQYIEEAGWLNEVPEPLRIYIDYEAYARDAGFNGMHFIEHDGDVWVFNP